MFYARVFYMAVPKPKIWRCEFKTLGEARAACKQRYLDPDVKGWAIMDSSGEIIEHEGVYICI